MHALCNINLTMVYVDKMQCNPPPLFFLVLNYLFLREQGKSVYDILYIVTKSKHLLFLLISLSLPQLGIAIK